MAAKKPILDANARTVLGKEVKKLRREGQLPANVYGKDLTSTAIQVETKAFENVFKEVGETGLIDLKFDGKSHPVLVKNIQLQYPLRIPLHVDFYQVNMKEKVKTMVPLEIVGEAKAVTDNIGLLLQQINEVEVEALPAELPEKLEVNVEQLAEIDQQITVSELSAPESVTVLTDPEQIIVRIAEPVVEEPEPEEETPEESETPESEAAEGGEETKENEQESESGEQSEEQQKE